MWFYPHSWLHKLFSDRNHIPITFFEEESWQVLPNFNKVKLCETVLSFKVRLFIQSWKEFIYLVNFGIKKKSVLKDPLIIIPLNYIVHL